jgi:hypothetical protein
MMRLYTSLTATVVALAATVGFDPAAEAQTNPEQIAREHSSTVPVAQIAKIVSVSSLQAWTDTGIDVRAGQTIDIGAWGAVKFSALPGGGTGPQGGPGCIAGPNAFTGRWVAPGAPCWSLVARVNSHAPVFIGQRQTFCASSDGRLYLGVNDEITQFGDNSGAWTTTVLVY